MKSKIIYSVVALSLLGFGSAFAQEGSGSQGATQSEITGDAPKTAPTTAAKTKKKQKHKAKPKTEE